MKKKRQPETERFAKAFPKASLKKSPRPGKCPVFGCRKDARQRGSLCSCHSMALWRKLHPLEAFFRQIRDRANRKKIVFEIDFVYFRQLCRSTGYHKQRGRKSHNLHIDRRDATKGYVKGNLRVITAAENCAKGATTDKARRLAYVVARLGYDPTKPPPDPDIPDDDEPSSHIPTEETPF